jgi:hypothetical protein
MSNRIEVSKGSASSLGSNGIISYKIDSIEDTLKVGLAQAKSAGWQSAAIDAPTNPDTLRTAFSVVAEFLFSNDTPKTIIFACPDDNTLEAGKQLVEETFS